jgi:hypothetical protein
MPDNDVFEQPVHGCFDDAPDAIDPIAYRPHRDDPLDGVATASGRTRRFGSLVRSIIELTADASWGLWS